MRPIVLSTCFAAALGVPSWLVAQTAKPQVSAAEWNLFLPEGEGKAQTVAYCGTCHDTSFVTTARMSKEAWVRQAEGMLARLSEDLVPDAPVIGNYLGEHFGPTRPKLQIPLVINCSSDAELAAFLGLNEKAGKEVAATRSAGPFTGGEDLKERLSFLGRDLQPLVRFVEFTQTCREGGGR